MGHHLLLRIVEGYRDDLSDSPTFLRHWPPKRQRRRDVSSEWKFFIKSNPGWPSTAPLLAMNQIPFPLVVGQWCGTGLSHISSVYGTTTTKATEEGKGCWLWDYPRQLVIVPSNFRKFTTTNGCWLEPNSITTSSRAPTVVSRFHTFIYNCQLLPPSSRPTDNNQH